MVAVIRVHEFGNADVLRYEQVDLPAPAAGEVRVAHRAIGLNYIDTYFRSGLYPVAEMPFIPGSEAAGEIVAVGEGVKGFAVGDRVAYVTQIGAYAAERNMTVDRLVKMPAGVSYEQAAAMMLKGMTAQYLLRRTYPVKAGDVVLVHAAAGGVGLIACQWASHLGATVIGTVGSADKAELAKANGCHYPILYRETDFVAEVKRITEGQGCHVVYDGIGKATFPASLDALRPLGMFVSYGNASGAIDAFPIGLLAQKGSLFVTRPTLFTYTAQRSDLEATAKDLFDVVAKGIVSIRINQSYPLAEAAAAHRDLEGRSTTGSTILLP